jgi:hypothetical protein
VRRHERPRLPVRFRAAFVSDAEIDELVERCRPWARAADVIDLPALRTTDFSDEDGVA